MMRQQYGCLLALALLGLSSAVYVNDKAKSAEQMRESMLMTLSTLQDRDRIAAGIENEVRDLQLERQVREQSASEELELAEDEGRDGDAEAAQALLDAVQEEEAGETDDDLDAEEEDQQEQEEAQDFADDEADVSDEDDTAFLQVKDDSDASDDEAATDADDVLETNADRYELENLIEDEATDSDDEQFQAQAASAIDSLEVEEGQHSDEEDQQEEETEEAKLTQGEDMLKKYEQAFAEQAVDDEQQADIV